MPAQTVERDYVIAHVLAALTRVGHEGLVFKGGTALRFCYLDQFRYSADLDFSLVGMSRGDALTTVSSAFDDARAAGGFEVLDLDDRSPPRIRFVGPLGRQRDLKIDLATNELVLETQRAASHAEWEDVEPGGTLLVYSETEIAGEKLRCVIQRLQCRDLLDLDVVFEQLGVDPGEAAARFRDKANHLGINPELLGDRYRERIIEYERRWQDELPDLVGEVPHFDAVERRVSRNLRRGQLI